MKVFLIVWLVFFASFLGGCFANEYYSYVSFNGKINLINDQKKDVGISQKEIFIYEKDKTIFYNDFGMQFKNCESKEWFCIFSNKLNFAIKKNWQPVKNKKWSKSNFEFLVIKEIEGSDGEKTFVIKATDMSNSKIAPSIVFYSQSKGLVGFISYYMKNNLSETYWLLNSKGLGAK